MSTDPKVLAIEEILLQHPELEDGILAQLTAATAPVDAPAPDATEPPAAVDEAPPASIDNTVDEAPPASIDNTVDAVDTTVGAIPAPPPDPVVVDDQGAAEIAAEFPDAPVPETVDQVGVPPASIDNTVAADTTAGAPEPPAAVEPEPEPAPPGKPAVSDILAQIDRADEALGFARALLAEL